MATFPSLSRPLCTPRGRPSSPSAFLLLLLLSTFLLLSVDAQQHARKCTHGGGLWGAAKETVEPIARPLCDTVRTKYVGLSDKGRFLAGACVGFGASRLVVRTAMKTIKTAGAAYIAFEAMEYAGILDDARVEKNRKLLEHSKDYVLRTVDGMRHDVRTGLNPARVSGRVKRSMERDKAGTVGFGAGAFFGFVL